MKISEVTDSDMKMLAQLINALQSAEYALKGKEVCALADTIRWFQKIGTDAARDYQMSKLPKSNDVGPGPTASEPGPVTPSQGLEEGVTLMSYQPGNLSA